MKLPDSLSKNSQQIQVKLKGGLGFPKYELTPYKVLSGKSGWETTTTRGNNSSLVSQLFTREEQKSTKQKSSFVFIDEVHDTAYVNIAVTTDLNYIDASRSIIKAARSPKEYEGGSSNYTALLQLNNRLGDWKISTLSKEDAEGWKRQSSFSGALSNGSREIRLREISGFEDGTKGYMGIPLGVIFEEDGKALAAVQFRGQIFKAQKQKFLWLSNKLEPDFKFLLATAATAIMARADQAGISLEDPSNR